MQLYDVLQEPIQASAPYVLMMWEFTNTSPGYCICCSKVCASVTIGGSESMPCQVNKRYQAFSNCFCCNFRGKNNNWTSYYIAIVNSVLTEFAKAWFHNYFDLTNRVL